jgi:hypothetical protein
VSPKTQFILLVGGATLALAAVSGTLAATLISDDSEPVTSTAVAARPTATPSSAPPNLDELPADLRQRVAALPERLRDQVLRRVEEGGLAIAAVEEILRSYEARNTSVRAGTVVEASDTLLRLEVLSTGERVQLAIDDKTVLHRGVEDIAGSDLKRDEIVLVLSMDGGQTAFSVTAFGISPF